jgi:dipeptidyl aminopeptidase/acylaminoacyl peptidase
MGVPPHGRAWLKDRDTAIDAPHRASSRIHDLELFGLRMGGPPWEKLDLYIRNSPIAHVHRVETPVLMAHGDLDFIGIQQAEEFFTGLYRLGKRARFVRYWGEAHGLALPQNQRDLLHRMFDWLDEHLGPDSGCRR